MAIQYFINTIITAQWYNVVVVIFVMYFNYAISCRRACVLDSLYYKEIKLH